MNNTSITRGLPIASVGTDFWAIDYSGAVYKDAGGTGSWSSITTLQTTPTGSMALGTAGSSSDLLVAYPNSTGIVFERYNSSTGAYISNKTISSSTSDLPGSVAGDSSGHVWVFYSKFLGSSSYDIQAFRYDGTSWEASPYAVTSDGANNVGVNSPLSEGSLTDVPIIWTTGTSSPYNVVTTNVSAPGASNSAPNTPSLSTPTSGATGVSVTPSFTLSTTDADSDYIQYRIYLYQSDCSTVVGSSPFAQASSQTGWSGQDADSGLAYASGTTATYAYQSTLSYNTTYCWKADAIDPAGSNTYSSASSTQTFTTLANSAPNTPSLSTPGSGATGVSITPSFTLSTTDTNGDYIEYRIYLYQSDCSTPVGSSPFAQTSSETGWSGQDADSGQAYASGTTATYAYQGSLSYSTTYCWKADAIDPGGSNGYSSASSTRTFTTTSAPASGDINVQGNVKVQGNVCIGAC